MPFVSFASAHALRARRRTIYAPPELNISAYDNTLIHNNIYYITEKHRKPANFLMVPFHFVWVTCISDTFYDIIGVKKIV